MMMNDHSDNGLNDDYSIDFRGTLSSDKPLPARNGGTVQVAKPRRWEIYF